MPGIVRGTSCIAVLCVTYMYNLYCYKSSLIHRCVYTDLNNLPQIICQSFSCIFKYLNALKQVTIWLQVNSHQTNLHLGQVNTKCVKSPQNILIKNNSEEGGAWGIFIVKHDFFLFCTKIDLNYLINGDELNYMVVIHVKNVFSI